jgi:spore coat protein CotH
VAATAAGCTALSSSGSGSSGAASLTGKTVSGAVDGDFFDQKTLHTLKVVFDQDDYDEMIQAYVDSQDKNWIEADVEIDGNVFKKAGIKLKGNSSLRSLAGGQGGGPGGQGGPRGARGAAASDGGGDTEASDAGGESASDGGGDAAGAMAPSDGGGDAPDGGGNGEDSLSKDDPSGLPWLIRLDKYTDGQSYSGRSRFAVRGNNTPTSMNEALALDVLSSAKVPAEKYAFTSFSANGGDAQLHLVLDVPDDDAWNADAYDGTGVTYKADSDGDYSYRGDTEDDYSDAFEAKFVADGISDEDAYSTLGTFLKFINKSDDDEFGSTLGEVLDVDEFATYLAVQELVQNTDDIDGPGNNSYLHYDPDDQIWQVVAWDQNLSYGGMGGGGQGGGPGGAPGGGQMPSDGGGDQQGGGAAGGPGGGQMPSDGGGDQQGGQEADDDDGGPGGTMRGNILSERFLANDDFKSLYEDTLASVKKAIYTSGDATDRLKTLESLLTKSASDLVTSDEVKEDAATITKVIEG